MKLNFNKEFKYERIYGTISAYTTTYNCLREDYPFLESIQSMLGFSQEVVVVDGCSDDGTWEKLQELSKVEPRIQLYQNEFNWDDPGVDGNQKAFSRALCTMDFLFQFDVDEVVHEDDYEKIKMITKRFPTTHDILHLPVIELWGIDEITNRRAIWKWRMSRNKPEISHGINKYARVTHEKTGQVYAREGMSDGCEYVNIMNYEPLIHTGFYNEDFEKARLNNPELFEQMANMAYLQLPKVFHYSWFNLERKIKQLRKGGNWDKMWSLLYQKETMERFPGVDTDEKVKSLAKHLYNQGAEDNDAVKGKSKINLSHPKIMEEWIKMNTNEY